jgi:nitric oxide reductase NorD protein
MTLQQLVNEFHRRISGIRPNDWELEEYLRPLEYLDEGQQHLVLGQVGVIWPVSHALCFNYLAKVPDVLGCLHQKQFDEWVRGLLDAYEREGLRVAQHFMDDVEKNFLCMLRGETGLRLEKVQTRLLSYIHGISGYALNLEGGAVPVTDSARIILPVELTIFPDEQKDYLLYKYAAAVQCGHLHCNTYRLRLEDDHPMLHEIAGRSGKKYHRLEPWLSGFFELFDDPDLAAEVFRIVQTFRIVHWIKEKYAGLYGDVRPLLENFAEIDGNIAVKSRQDVMEILDKYIHAPDDNLISLDRQSASLPMYRIHQCLENAIDSGMDDGNVLRQTVAVYRHVACYQGNFTGLRPSPILGTIDPQAAHEVILQRRIEDRKKFVHQLAGLLQFADRGKGRRAESKEKVQNGPDDQGREGALLLLDTANGGNREKKGEHRQATSFLTIGGKEVSLPEEMRQLVSSISRDLGGVPLQYISSAVGLAGEGGVSLEAPETGDGKALQGDILYDEWDFRRKGYKKHWCHVLEKRVPEVSGSFVVRTLEKHRGLLIKLRRQFEMMRQQQRLAKRQREGDEIDLDAVTDFFADRHAGLSPSERFFMKMVRDTRDIAVFFLVDMSSSTEGWIMNAIKESLLLMGESLHVLGDRFAIYGFSGMRRLRSDVFMVKAIDEPYGETIRNRIAGINPQEYTRMGPPIRHLVKLMSEVEARTRLLIILSDGKPEDYDDYKGRYAIEDTRHALIEAKAAGIHPFCITVDRKARDYIQHMYGEVNYIQINDVSQLPVRIPSVYRALTVG